MLESMYGILASIDFQQIQQVHVYLHLKAGDEQRGGRRWQADAHLLLPQRRFDDDKDAEASQRYQRLLPLLRIALYPTSNGKDEAVTK